MIPQPLLNLPIIIFLIFTYIICHSKINLGFMFALNFDIIPYPHNKVVHVDFFIIFFWNLRFALRIINILPHFYVILEFATKILKG